MAAANHRSPGTTGRGSGTPTAPSTPARLMHTVLARGLSKAARMADRTLPRHLLRLETTLYDLAGDDRTLQLVPLRLRVFRDHWPTPAPDDMRYRRDLRAILKVDLPRLRDQLLNPNPRHSPPPAPTRKPRRRA